MVMSSQPVVMSSDQPFLTPAFLAPRSQQATFGQRAPMLPPININPKLPSLEGLLKQMQVGGAPRASPVEEEPVPTHHLSPVPRETTPMPSLRSMISPSMSKSAFVPVMTAPVQPRATPLIPLSYPSQAYSQTAPVAYAPRKRSWADASPVRSATFQVTKERVGSPASSTTSSSGPHRSRASKYCKVEGCERVSQRNNLCHSHGGKRLCKEEGCSSKDRGNGYCIKHGGGKICSMAGCEKKARRKGLCTQHFRVAEEGAAVSSSYAANRVVYGSL